MQPLHDKVIIKPIQDPERIGRFYTPEYYRSKHVQVGIVRYTDGNAVVAPGDVVVFMGWQAECFPYRNQYDSFTDWLYCLYVEELEARILIDRRIIVPLGDRVLINPEHVPERAASGLYTPASEVTECATGIVLATGPDVRDICDDDRVVFAPSGDIIPGQTRNEDAGKQIYIDGCTYLMFHERELLARVI